MSPSPAAPSSASTIAWVSTSASEWPARPCSLGTVTPPSTSGRPGAKRWLSMPIPVRTQSADRLGAALAALEDAELADPDLLEQRHGLFVAVAELVGQVRVARERDGQPRLDDQLQEAARRVDLAHGLAQAGGRDLDRDPALEEALDGRLVVAAQVALRHR